MKKVVIIGGGLGGLTTGALLAQDGYQVTLLEQHNIVGGCATTFKRKGGFTCEVGLHEMDGVYANPTIKKVFEKLKVYENIEFVKPNEFFKVYTKYGSFTVPEGIYNIKKALTSRFPNEQEGIAQYFEIIVSIADCYAKLSSLKWYHYPLFPILFAPILKYKNKSVSDVLDKLISNEELKMILNANVQYYNDSPKTLSILLHAVAQVSYYRDGGYFIKGGSYKLSKYLGDVIQQNGGKIITKALATKISQNSVTFVNQNTVCTIEADIIVSNISPEDTYKLSNTNYQEKFVLAESITTIYFGFSKNLKNLYGKSSYSNFIMDGIGKNNDISIQNNQQPFVFVDYSQIDSGLVDESKSFGAICLIDTLSNWEQLNDDEYKSKKNLVLEGILLKLDKYYPNIKNYIEYIEVATPKTMQRYLKTPNGTAYGYKPTPSQFFKIPQVKSKKINNLYFTGQFVISGGFSPAIISAELCCKQILKEK